MEFEPLKLNPEEFKNLSFEEKKEFVRKLVHLEAADVKAAFVNAKTGQSVSVKELAEEIGEEQAIEMIVKAMEASVNSDVKTLSKDDIKKLAEKASRGECTEEELTFLRFVANQSNDHIQFEQGWLDSTINLIHFAQKDIGYRPILHDVLSSTIMLFTLSSILSKDGVFSKYNPEDANIVGNICENIGNDIYDTWKASCTSLPEPELIINGLLWLADKIATENNIPFSNAEDIADILGIPLFQENGDTENGSNEQCDCNICQPKTYNPSSEDEEMRDLLKE